MPNEVTLSELRSIGENHAAKGSWCKLDLACLAIGAAADYAADVASFTIGGTTVMALDPANDTADDSADRSALRNRILSNLLRNARKVHGKTADIRAFHADVPAPTKDDPNAYTRGYVVTRTK